MSDEYERVEISVDLGGRRLSIGVRDKNHCGHGYRIAGPKYGVIDGGTEYTHQLSRHDAEEIRAYLAVIHPTLSDLADAHGSPRWPEWQRIARALSARAAVYREDAVKLAESDDPNLTVWAEAYRLTASALEQLARETEQEAKQR